MMDLTKGKITTVIVATGIIMAAYTAGASGVLVQQKVSAAPVLYNADTVTGIYDDASPAVVDIETAGPPGHRTVEGRGSGFLIDNQGHILTNKHVVDGAASVKVILGDGNSVNATVLGTDAIHDLAIISVNVSAVNGIAPLQLGNSGAAKPGQMAIAIGTPYGLTDTVTVGVISGLNRTIRGTSLTGMLQTDAALNPGNSGGPLLDANGMVIGINTAIGTEGGDRIGFAVPSNVANSVLADLIAGKQITRPWLGISGAGLTPTLVQSLNLTVNQGVYVISVFPGSPAEKAGLKGGEMGGDVIAAVDGKSVKKFLDLSSYLSTKNVGDTVTLSILRQSSPMDVKVTLGSRPTITP